MDSILKDERFAKIATDRKFRGGGKKQKKVQIDKRFQSMYNEERFVSKCTVDKRGRPQNFTSKENYRKYYDLKDSDESESEDESDEEDEDENDSGSSEVEEEEEEVDLDEKEDKSESEPEDVPEVNLESTVKVTLNHNILGCFEALFVVRDNSNYN